MNGSKPNSAEEAMSEREPIGKVGRQSRAWHPYMALPFSAAYESPACSTSSEQKRPPISALNHVILLLMYTHRKIFRIFVRVGGEGLKSGIFGV